ncbi:MAG TPA: DUF2330 domain-containing protein [Polyangiaceae bacterium]|nr:DUF2330 domain-containing protein [Polyangiaceae bacterium]
MKHYVRAYWVGFLAAASVIAGATRAEACGGFFCSQVQPVNQAAERIIFADNGDGTQTAVIEIMYQGPSQHFSWVLPISSVPMGSQIKVASDIAFQRLQAATNPQYTLTTSVEGTCKPEPTPQYTGAGGSSSGVLEASTGGTGGGAAGGGVTVEASGVVGSFDWTVISLDTSVTDPASAAVKWLGDNGFDVPAGAPDLLGPYLADGLYLLALKLTKGSDTGSIRPIVLTYAGTQASIPIKLTAVSANDNMGVMTWLLGDSRAVPQNYLSLELNEARIDWFNASLNYNDVVTAAADDAGGQGFVTELAGPTDPLANVVWGPSDDATWNAVKSRTYSSFDDVLQTTQEVYGSYDGYWDAVQAVVTLPDGVTFADFKQCTSCYSGQIQVPPAQLMDQLQTLVIDPIRDVQTLVSSHPHVTRLYTTMSADEMTLDPLFTFNPDLPDESNVHTATRVIECNPDIYQSDAPWRIELPQGGVVRGTPSTTGSWPTALSNQPPNRVITRQSDSGDGKTIEDNTDAINAALDAYNASLPPTPASSAGGSGGNGGTTGAGTGGVATSGGNSSAGTSGTGAAGGVSGSSGSAATAGSTSNGGASGSTPAGQSEPSGHESGGGCALAQSGPEEPWAALFGLVLFGFWRRRKG